MELIIGMNNFCEETVFNILNYDFKIFMNLNVLLSQIYGKNKINQSQFLLYNAS